MAGEKAQSQPRFILIFQKVTNLFTHRKKPKLSYQSLHQKKGGSDDLLSALDVKALYDPDQES